jgi:hypothetical protein
MLLDRVKLKTFCTMFEILHDFHRDLTTPYVAASGFFIS